MGWWQVAVIAADVAALVGVVVFISRDSKRRSRRAITRARAEHAARERRLRARGEM